MNYDNFDNYTAAARRPILTALTCLLALSSSVNSEISAESHRLLDSDLAHFQEINCDSGTDEGVMTIHANREGKDTIIDCDVSKLAISGPVELQFKMRTEVHGELGEYVVYWITEGNSDWKQFERILFRPDGQWHSYRLPLAASGRLRAIRFTFGKQPHQIELSEIRLVSLPPTDARDAVPRPSELAASVELTAKDLSLSLHTADHRYTIHDEKTGRIWRSEAVSDWLALVNVEKVDDRTLKLEMFDRFARQPITAQVALTKERAVRFSLSAASYDAPVAGASRYPPRFSADLADGQFVFCDRSCGVLLDQHDPTYSHWPLRVYGNTNCLDMPWVGLFDHDRRDGMMLLAETPADAEVAFIRHADGRHWPEVRWLPSMDRFEYPRTASLRFSESGGYVALAKNYRKYLKEQNRFRTLAEKRKDKPEVERLRGAPALWGGRLPAKFIRQMRPLGIRRGIVNNCKEPGIVAWLNELGYLTGCYDGYTDFLEGETAFHRDSVAKAAVRSRPGGPPKHGWKLRGGRQMFWRSSALWNAALNSYVVRELSQIPYTARFIDVGAAAELLEDYHPDHTLDRRQDLSNRRALYERMNDFGLVLGTEHGNDWVTDLVEYFEGTMSGPFWWSSWPAGYLDRPRRDQFTENYLKFGIGFAHRVPLWELVYHDCALTTWYWGDTAGLLFEAAPELSDRKDLLNILYGTTPLFWINGTGFRLPEEVHRMLRSYHDTCPLHEVVAFEQMLSHEFLSEDRAVQRTQFANGTTIVVNFSEEPRAMEVDSQEVFLAPRGFHVQGPGISQTRLWINEAAQTVIRKPGYLTVEADGKQSVAGVKCDGRFTAFRSSETQWNVFVTPGRRCELNLTEVTGWDPSDNVRVCHMDDLGEARRSVSDADATGIVSFASEENAWRFAIVRNAPQAQLTQKRESSSTESWEAVSAPEGESEYINSLSEAEQREGFKLLFNGVDLENWQHSGNWAVESGAIHRVDNGGALTYARALIPDDFELRFQWKVAKGSNSGVYYRPGQYEYQILDNQGHSDGRNPRTSAAALYFCMAPSQDATRPVGHWNTGRVVCKGTVIQHWLNGQKVVDFDYADPKWRANVELLQQLNGDLSGRNGHLHLQDHGDPVWYRGIKIRQLGQHDKLDRTPVIPADISAVSLQREQETVKWFQSLGQ